VYSDDNELRMHERSSCLPCTQRCFAVENNKHSIAGFTRDSSLRLQRGKWELN